LQLHAAHISWVKSDTITKATNKIAIIDFIFEVFEEKFFVFGTKGRGV